MFWSREELSVIETLLERLSDRIMRDHRPIDIVHRAAATLPAHPLVVEQGLSTVGRDQN